MTEKQLGTVSYLRKQILFSCLSHSLSPEHAYHSWDWFCLLSSRCPLSLPWAKTLGLSLATAEQDSLTSIENRFILGEDLASYLVTEIGTRAIAFKRITYYWQSDRAAENWCLRKAIWGFPGILFSAVFVPNEDSKCSWESSSKACSGVSQQKEERKNCRKPSNCLRKLSSQKVH